MPTRLVDVFDREGKLLQTYPVVLTDAISSPVEDEFKREALKLAKDDTLVPDEETGFLNAKVRP